MYSKNLVAATLQVGLVLATFHNVNVGGNRQIVFTPNIVQALPGDTVRFTFQELNHTVTAGNPLAPCQPATPLKFNSNFVPVNANASTKPTFDVAITNLAPITVYCAQAMHCQGGMVMVINPTAIVRTLICGY
jgi:plastocyanin